MTDGERVTFSRSKDAEEVFTPEFNNLVAGLYDEFKERIYGAREARIDMVGAARKGKLPGHLTPSSATTDNWEIPTIPEELRKPGIEISGPASITPMFINAINPGPEGNRAEGYLDDDEDAGGHRLEDTVAAAMNRRGAARRSLKFENPVSKKLYEIQDGDIPFFMHRERGLHLDEQDYQVDGNPIPATLLGTAATLFHAGKAQNERGQGIYFYIPKTESPEEAGIYRDIFASVQNRVPELKDATIRGILLVESLPLVWAMEEALHALGPYAAGLNAARWDLKASLLEYVMSNAGSVWPDRFGVSVAGTPFIANIFRRLVAVCNKHNAVPIGGMATALPSRDDEVNQEASKAIRSDKEWEAEQGFIRAWVAHIYHMEPAAEPFKEFHRHGKQPKTAMSSPSDYPIKIETPEGPVTLEGTRQNVRTLIEYVEGWLNGRGAKGIDRLMGMPGKRAALMEDLATARISVAQVAQRVIHGVVGEDTGEKHTEDLIKRMVASEGEEIIRILGKTADSMTVKRYQDAVKISTHWIGNYNRFDFRSLGSYSREELAEIAAADTP